MMKPTEVSEENRGDFDYISVLVDTNKGERIGKRLKKKREPNAARKEGGTPIVDPIVSYAVLMLIEEFTLKLT